MKKILFLLIWTVLATGCTANPAPEAVALAQDTLAVAAAFDPAAAEGSASKQEVQLKPVKPEPRPAKKKKTAIRKKKAEITPIAADTLVQPAPQPDAEDTALTALDAPSLDERIGVPGDDTSMPVSEPLLFETSEFEPAGYKGTLSAGDTGTSSASAVAAVLAAGTDSGKPAKKSRFLPMSRRVDRGINQGRFAYKGELMVGLTASYGTMTNEDTEFMVILNNITMNGTIATVKPFIGYFYRNNRCLGVRFGYQHISGTLGNVDLDLGEQNDLTLGLGNMSLTSDSYSFGIYHRSYVGLDSRGRFGLFAEVEASMMTGTMDFINGAGDGAKVTYSDNFKAKIGFAPGLAVYVFPNVCATLSIGLGGIQYSSVTQHDAAGNEIGSRKASKMQFRLNIADINFGMTVHFWDHKKR